MSRMNTPRKNDAFTHEGAPTRSSSPEDELRRAVLSCMLWEGTFYESGQSIADRIHDLASQCKPEFVVNLTAQARNEYKIRHASLWLAMALIKNRSPGAEQALYDAIQRPDEITESLAMYWAQNGGRKSSVKVPRAWMRAVARCFLEKFNEYQLSKYNRTDNEITLKDAYFLSHPMAMAKRLKVKLTDDRVELFKRLVDNKLEVADTWETRLSAGDGKTSIKDKREAFTDLLKRKKMGGMALLRNLRNMSELGVDKALVRDRLAGSARKNPSLPFRYIAAAKAVPHWEDIIDEAMLASFDTESDGIPKLKGRTVILVDVSASMNASLSSKSQMRRIDAACGLAILAREVSDDCAVFQFATKCRELPIRRGMALRDIICDNWVGHGTNIGDSVGYVNNLLSGRNYQYDRLIVITDMQSNDGIQAPMKGAKGYIINTAPYENAIGFGKYMHFDGWSDHIIRFIQEIESVQP